MRKIPFSTLIIFNTVLIAQTNVSGIISSSTTWSTSGSPYNLTGEVQVAYGATLTVDPGVTVNGHNNILKIFGKLSAIGTASSFTILNDIDIQPSSNTSGSTNEKAEIVIQYTRLYGGKLLRTFSGSTIGGLLLKDSELYTVNNQYGSGYLYLYWPMRETSIERNIFHNSGPIIAYTRSTGSEAISVYIRNNVFYWTMETTSARSDYMEKTSAVHNQDNSDTETIVQYNTFVNTDRVAVSVPNETITQYANAGMTATNNYWSTTDEEVIKTMIYDKNDNLGAPSYISYSPWLTEPHSDTPTRDTTSPTAGTVNDGTSTDISSTTTRTSLSANWSGFSDSHSGIEDYSYSIGTTSGGTDLKSWTSNGASTSITVSDLSLTAGTTYYFSVKATDYAGNVSGVATSNGVKVVGIVYTVKKDGTGDTNNIVYAVQNSNPGDTVLVYEGTYEECPEISGGQYVKSLFNSSSDSTAIKNTIIKCPQGYNIKINDSTLEGFTLTGRSPILIDGTSTLKHLVFMDITIPGLSGNVIEIGTSVEATKASLQDIKMMNNKASAINLFSGELTGKNIIISNSGSPIGRMGFSCREMNSNVAYLENIRIAHNKAGPSSGVAGGAMHISGNCNVTVLNGEFYDNLIVDDSQSRYHGSSVMLSGEAVLKLINVTSVGNRALYVNADSDTTVGPGISLGWPSYTSEAKLTISNSIIYDNLQEISAWGGTIEINNSLVKGGKDSIRLFEGGELTWGDNNIDIAPYFLNPAQGDFHLMPYSPAIGAGTSSGISATDIDGNTRPAPSGSNPDVGAYEHLLADPAPGPFELFSPFQGDTVEINRHNYNDSLFFTWTEAIDASGDDVTYEFEFTGDLGVLYWHFFDHCDETEFMCKVPNHRIEDFLSIEGVEVVSGTWSVIATDGKGYSYPTNGPFELTIDASSVSVDEPMLIPETFALHANYPNPFNPTTTISYDLPKRSLVTLGIYDLLGKQIKTLVNKSQDAGNKIAIWDGTDDLGRQVSAGVYLYQIQAGEFSQTRKMLLLK